VPASAVSVALVKRMTGRPDENRPRAWHRIVPRCPQPDRSPGGGGLVYARGSGIRVASRPTPCPCTTGSRKISIDARAGTPAPPPRRTAPFHRPIRPTRRRTGSGRAVKGPLCGRGLVTPARSAAGRPVLCDDEPQHNALPAQLRPAIIPPAARGGQRSMTPRPCGDRSRHHRCPQTSSSPRSMAASASPQANPPKALVTRQPGRGPLCTGTSRLTCRFPVGRRDRD
jgi:hypothetical protein